MMIKGLLFICKKDAKGVVNYPAGWMDFQHEDEIRVGNEFSIFEDEMAELRKRNPEIENLKNLFVIQNTFCCDGVQAIVVGSSLG